MTNDQMHDPSDPQGSGAEPGDSGGADARSVGFTPGPWKVGNDGDVAQAYGDEWILAFDPDFENEDRQHGAPGVDECHANARLIAKAPEMFDLVCDLVEVLGKLRTLGDPSVQRRLGLAEHRAGKLIREVRGE